MMEEEKLVRLVEFRRQLHAHPEVSGKEEKTAGRIRELLEGTGARQIVEIGGTGLAAIYHGEKPGPTVLLRCELDALPIAEENDFEHRSQVDNVSHKCGHDGHMAILVGVAGQIAERPPGSGKLVLLFQPAEETGEGARTVLKDPAFPSIEPDYVFALHNLPGFPKGTVVVKQGAFTAAVCTLVIFLKGKTAHAAEPENGINPIFAVTEIVQKTRELEETNPANPDFALITPVYTRVGEPAYGTAPGDGEIHLTIRAWNNQHLESICKEITDWALVYGLKTGLKVETEVREEFRANVNDPLTSQMVAEAASENGFLIGKTAFPFRWGEDFGIFTESFPGSMFGIGAGDDCPALHNPDYDFPDELLPTGVAMMETLVRKLLG